MPLKNQTVELTIEDLTEEGLGIGKADGFPLFVKDAVPGDRIRAVIVKDKKTYGYGRLLEILEPSPFRVDPPCPVAKSCGGCQIQALRYDRQLELKRIRVKNAMERIGRFAGVEIPPVLGMEHPWHYRNKAEYPVRADQNGDPVAGFYAGRTHSVIRSDSCMIGQPEEATVVSTVLDWMKRNSIAPYDEETQSGVVRHILIRKSFSTEQVLVCIVINQKTLPHAEDLTESLQKAVPLSSLSYCVNTAQTNAILTPDVRIIFGSSYLEDTIGSIRYRFSAQSFFQVNPIQTKVLYDLAKEYCGLTGVERIWDLYCGIGTIALYLAAEAAHVLGIEIIDAAIRNAKDNAALNGIRNTTFLCGNVGEVLQTLDPSESKPDVIIVDPPRKGCSPDTLDTIFHATPDRIIYVSCNPSTLARDARILCENGYMLQQIQPVDMFPHTVHVETVVLLTATSGSKAK